MPDYVPWSVPIATTLYIAAHMLLENKQARGRLLIARAKQLAAFIATYLGVDHA